MILCELEDECVKGYELSPSEPKVKHFKEEQLTQGFRIYSAITNTSQKLTDFHFATQNVNAISVKEDVYHILEMYTYGAENQALYEEVFKKYLAGEYDSLNVNCFSQTMKLANSNVSIRDILRLLIIDDYRKLNVSTVGPNKDIYQAKTILQLNEKLHLLHLLLQDTPVALDESRVYFNLSDEELKSVFDNFNFNSEPVFVSPLNYIDKMQKLGLADKEEYLNLSKKSESVLKLVRSSKN